MYRLFLVSALLVVLFFLLRRAIRGFRHEHLDREMASNLDQMVEDPVCHMYVPRRSAVIQQIGDRTYCFCSSECAAAFHARETG